MEAYRASKVSISENEWRSTVGIVIRRLMRTAALVLMMAMAGCSGSPSPSVVDVAYADRSASQRLNLYLPQGRGPFPVVVMIHGGAFAFGDPSDVGPGFKVDVDAMTANGIAVASIGYRLSGEATFPAAVQDVKAALRFIRREAVTYRIDPSRIALWGKSAGANLALLGGLARDGRGFDAATPGGGAKDDRVRAIVAFYPPVNFATMDIQLARRGCRVGSGPFDGAHDPADSPESKYLGGALATVPDRVAASDPTQYVTVDAPPIYLTAGTADCTVPADQSRQLFDALRIKAPTSNPQLVLVPDAKHADPVFDKGANLRRVVVFLKAYLQ